MIAVDGALRREYRIVIIGYDETVQLNEKRPVITQQNQRAEKATVDRLFRIFFPSMT